MANRYRGQFLKNLRMQKNLNLRRVADETRITTFYLAGIEEEQFDRFPGKFYFNSFTKQLRAIVGPGSEGSGHGSRVRVRRLGYEASASGNRGGALPNRWEPPWIVARATQG